MSTVPSTPDWIRRSCEELNLDISRTELDMTRSLLLAVPLAMHKVGSRVARVALSLPKKNWPFYKLVGFKLFENILNC